MRRTVAGKITPRLRPSLRRADRSRAGARRHHAEGTGTDRAAPRRQRRTDRRREAVGAEGHALHPRRPHDDDRAQGEASHDHGDCRSAKSR